MQCSMNSNEPPLGKWIEDSVKFHGCSMQEPPPDGSGGLLALGTLSLPFPVKVSRSIALTRILTPLSFISTSGLISKPVNPLVRNCLLKGSIKEKDFPAHSRADSLTISGLKSGHVLGLEMRNYREFGAKTLTWVAAWCLWQSSG